MLTHLYRTLYATVKYHVTSHVTLINPFSVYNDSYILYIYTYTTIWFGFAILEETPQGATGG